MSYSDPETTASAGYHKSHYSLKNGILNRLAKPALSCQDDAKQQHQVRETGIFRILGFMGHRPGSACFGIFS